ncbi:MAG: hypothetical protein AAGJ93_06125 [Bacteroidota bacterium]
MDRTISIVDFPEVMLFTEQDHFETTLKMVSSQAGVHTYKLSLTSKGGSHSPETITLRWRLPSFNMKGVWKCGVQHDKRQQYDWELDHLQSRISVDAPLVSVFGHDDQNAINLVEMNALLREEDNHLYCHVSFFQERHPEINSYEAEIRIDTRDVPYYTAIKDSAS